MRILQFVRVVAALVVFLVVAFAAAIPAGAQKSSAEFSGIDAYVRAQMTDAHLPGLALGIVQGDHVIHMAGFGTADGGGRAVTPATPFVIGSVSKSFTALAVMQLVEEGQVDLDAAADRYVPDFHLADSSDSNRITVRQLLNQTSGIPTAAGIDPLTGPVTDLDRQVRALSAIAPVTAPGGSYAYSNANYEVLGRLVENVSGMSYGAYLQDRVFGPLGMVDSFTSVDSARAAGLAGGCEIWFGLDKCLAPGTGFRSDFVPAGFVMSSVQDMSQYLVAQLNHPAGGGKGILSPTDITLMHTPAVYAGLSAQGGSYGMGWFIGPRAGIAHTVWHDGSAAASHSMVLLLPDSGWGIVVLTNAESLLYSMLGRIDIIVDGIAARLVGSRDPGTLGGLYLAFDAVAMLLTALQLRSLVRLVRRPAGVPARKNRLRVIAGEVVVPVWRELIVPVGILVGLPGVLSAPWVNLAQTDLGAWLFGFALLLLATAVVRAVRTRSAWLSQLQRVRGRHVQPLAMVGE